MPLPEPPSRAALRSDRAIPTLPGPPLGAPAAAESTNGGSSPSGRRAGAPRVDPPTLLRRAATIAFAIATVVLAGAGSWPAAVATGLTAAALLLWAYRAAVSVALVVGAAFVLRAVVAFVAKQDGLTQDRASKTPPSS